MAGVDGASLMAKNFTFSLGLSTGKFVSGMKSAVSSMRSHFADIGKSMRKSIDGGSGETFKKSFKKMNVGIARFKKDFRGASTIEEMTAAFGRLSFTGVKALSAFVNPITVYTAAAIGAVKVLKEWTAQFEELEQAQTRLSRSFRMGGRMQGSDPKRFQSLAGSLAKDGMFSEEEITQGIAGARASSYSLSSKQMEEAAVLAKDIAVTMGTDYASALERTAGLLHAETVSMEDLLSAGVVLSAEEARRLETMQGVYKTAERQLFVMEKLKEANKGAAKEQQETLSGQYQTFSNTLKSMMVSVGKILAPIMRVVMEVVNPVVQAIQELFAPIADTVGGALSGIADVIIGILRPLGALLKSVFSLVGKGFAAIGKPLKTMWSFLGKIVKTLGTWLADGIMKVADFISGILEKFQSLLDWGNRLWTLFGGSEDPEEQKKKEGEWVDPRLKYTTHFEDALSMNQRIQQSIFEKHSPAQKQVDLLGKIYGVLLSGNEDSRKDSRSQIAAAEAQTKAIKRQNLGLQGG